MLDKATTNAMSVFLKGRAWPKLKIFIQSPAGAGFWAVGLCWLFCFVLWEPAYLTNDDILMRGVLSGTHFPGFGPSEFTLYMSTVLGVFIKNLYLPWPGVNCYEIFFYLALSGSVWVSIYTLARVARRTDYTCYLLVLFILPFIFSVPFLARQFTMTSGLTACGGLLVFYSLFNDPSTSARVWLAKGLYVIFSLWLSSLIRFDASLTYGFIGGLYLLPLLPWRNFKKLLALSVVAGLTLCAVLGTEHVNQAMIRNNPDWQYRKDINHYTTNIFNNSIFAHPEDMADAWRLVDERNVSFNDEKGAVSFGKDYYKLVLAWALAGETHVNNPENMAKVSETLGPQLSNLNNKSLFPLLYQPTPIDKIANYIWILLPLLLMFRNKKVWGLSLYFATCFFLVAAVICHQFRPLPYRLWYGYAVIFSSFLILYIVTNYRSIQDSLLFTFGPKSFHIVFSIFLAIAVLGAGYNLVYKHQRQARMLLRFTNAIKQDIERLRLDKNPLYIIDGSTYYLGTAPLRADPWPKAAPKRIVLTPFILDPKHHDVLKRYGISLQNTIEDICRREDARFLFAPKSWWGTFYGVKYNSHFTAMANFLRERHHLEIGAVDVTPIATKELTVFQVSPLDHQERQIRREFMALQKRSSRIKNNYEAIAGATSAAILNAYQWPYDADHVKLMISLEKIHSFLGVSDY